MRQAHLVVVPCGEVLLQHLGTSGRPCGGRQGTPGGRQALRGIYVCTALCVCGGWGKSDAWAR